MPNVGQGPAQKDGSWNSVVTHHHLWARRRPVAHAVARTLMQHDARSGEGHIGRRRGHGCSRLEIGKSEREPVEPAASPATFEAIVRHIWTAPA